MHRRPHLSRGARVGTRAGARTPAAALIAAGLVVTAVTACSDDSVSAAPHASDPACGTALAKLPSALLGKSRATSSATGTAVYGDPKIVVRCGVPPLGPTQLRCLGLNDVDWVIDDRKDPLIFTTYGRSPAVEVRIPASYPLANDPEALADLEPVAELLPKTSRTCD